MRYQLENEHVILAIDTKGAEIKSLVKKESGLEYMWSGDGQFWGRTSPILFPVVGRFYQDSYRHEGKTYTMAQHGFARDMEFALIRQSENEIWMRLESNDASKENYPFDFILEIGYGLKQNQVKVMWKAVNQGKQEMYFSIGAHPGFACPLVPGERQEDYCIKFNRDVECIQARVLSEGCVSEEIEEYRLEEGGLLPLTEGIFDQDALILEGGQAKEVSLVRPNGAEYVTVGFDAPLVGIWSPPKKHAPFVCIEPWYGRCDPVGYAGELQDREWGNWLKAGEAFEASYVISVK